MAYTTRAMLDRASADRREERAGADLQLMRRLDREFSEQAINDRMAAFPILTAENAAAAMAFQEARVIALRDGRADYQAALARVRRIR